MKKLKIGIKCNHCGSIIFSEFTHDFKECECGKVFIDGGNEYIRIGGNREDFEYVLRDEDGKIEVMDE